MVTVSYRSDLELEIFLRSLTGSRNTIARIVVADNDASNGSASAVADRWGAAYLPLRSNVGYGAAVNAAVRSLPSSVEWILVSNPDVVVTPGALDVLIRTARAEHRVGMIGPKVMNEDGSVYPSGRDIPSLGNGIGHALFANIWQGNPWSRRYRNVDQAVDKRRDVGWLSGSCLLISRQAFDEAKGFDENFFMYFEDVDLGSRFGSLGWRNVYEPDAVVTHLGARSTSSNSAEMIRVHHRSAAHFLRKRYSAPLMLPVRWCLLVGLRIRSWQAVRRGV